MYCLWLSALWQSLRPHSLRAVTLQVAYSNVQVLTVHVPSRISHAHGTYSLQSVLHRLLSLPSVSPNKHNPPVYSVFSVSLKCLYRILKGITSLKESSPKLQHQSFVVSGLIVSVYALSFQCLLKPNNFSVSLCGKEAKDLRRTRSMSLPLKQSFSVLSMEPSVSLRDA